MYELNYTEDHVT